MSSSMYVVGFRPVDAEWERNLQVYNACKNNGIELPESVSGFFGELIECGRDPLDSPGIEVCLDKNSAITKYNEDMREGYEIKISELPKDVHVIRVFMSY